MVCFSLSVFLLVCPCVSQDSELEAMIRHMADVLNGDSVGEYLYDLISLSFHTGKCIKQRLIHQIYVFCCFLAHVFFFFV